MKSYRKKAMMRRAGRVRAVALPVLRQAVPRPSERGNRLVMAGLYLALLLGTAFFLGFMYIVLVG